ncbi:TPA: hypothetical protein ACGXMY_005636 [Bacillus cereus]
MVIEKTEELVKRMEAALNETDKDKQRKIVQEIKNSPELAWFQETLRNIWRMTYTVVEQLWEMVKQATRTATKQQRINSFRRQHIKHKRWY